jgi:hypothetical protein
MGRQTRQSSNRQGRGPGSRKPAPKVTPPSKATLPSPTSPPGSPVPPPRIENKAKAKNPTPTATETPVQLANPPVEHPVDLAEEDGCTKVQGKNTKAKQSPPSPEKTNQSKRNRDSPRTPTLRRNSRAEALLSPSPKKQDGKGTPMRQEPPTPPAKPPRASTPTATAEPKDPTTATPKDIQSEATTTPSSLPAAAAPHDPTQVSADELQEPVAEEKTDSQATGATQSKDKRVSFSTDPPKEDPWYVDPDGPLTESYHRLMKNGSWYINDASKAYPITKDHFLDEASLTPLEELKQYLCPQNGVPFTAFPAEAWEKVVNDALSGSSKSFDPYFSNSQGKKKAAKLCLSLSLVPLDSNPDWNGTTKRLKATTPLAMLHLYTYKRLGPVYYRRQPPATEPENQAAPPDPAPVINPYKKKTDTSSPTTTPAPAAATSEPELPSEFIPAVMRPKLPETSYSTFFDVILSRHTSFHGLEFTKKWETRDQAARDLLQDLCKRIWKADPAAQLGKFPSKNLEYLDLPNLFSGSPRPKKWMDIRNYLGRCWLYASGDPPRCTIYLHTSVPPEQIATGDHLTGVKGDKCDPPKIRVSLVQAADYCSTGWFYSSTRETDLEILQTAINDHPTIKAIDGLRVFLVWKAVKVTQQEDTRGSFVGAVHVMVSTEYYVLASRALSNIYHPKNKTGFPLNLKWAYIPDTASSENTTATVDMIRTVATARNKQEIFLRDVTQITLDDSIIDLYGLFDPNDPVVSVHNILLGMVEPGTKRPLFQGVFKNWRRPHSTSIVCVVRKSAWTKAQQICSALGTICSNHYGEVAWSKFSAKHREEQAILWKFNEATGRYEGLDYRIAQDGFLKTALFQEYDIQPEANASCPIRSQIQLSGPFRTRSRHPLASADVASATTAPAHTQGPSTWGSISLSTDGMDTSSETSQSKKDEEVHDPTEAPTSPPDQIQVPMDEDHEESPLDVEIDHTLAPTRPSQDAPSKIIFSIGCQEEIDRLKLMAETFPPPKSSDNPKRNLFSREFVSWLQLNPRAFPDQATIPLHEQFWILFLLYEQLFQNPSFPYTIREIFASVKYKPTFTWYDMVAKFFHQRRQYKPTYDQYVTFKGSQYLPLPLIDVIVTAPELQLAFSNSWMASSSQIPHQQYIPQFLVDYTNTVTNDDTPADPMELLEYVTETEGDLTRLEELQQNMITCLYNDWYRPPPLTTLELTPYEYLFDFWINQEPPVTDEQARPYHNRLKEVIPINWPTLIPSAISETDYHFFTLVVAAYRRMDSDLPAPYDFEDFLQSYIAHKTQAESLSSLTNSLRAQVIQRYLQSEEPPHLCIHLTFIEADDPNLVETKNILEGSSVLRLQGLTNPELLSYFLVEGAQVLHKQPSKAVEMATYLANCQDEEESEDPLVLIRRIQMQVQEKLQWDLESMQEEPLSPDRASQQLQDSPMEDPSDDQQDEQSRGSNGGEEY